MIILTVDGRSPPSSSASVQRQDPTYTKSTLSNTPCGPTTIPPDTTPSHPPPPLTPPPGPPFRNFNCASGAGVAFCGRRRLSCVAGEPPWRPGPPWSPHIHPLTTTPRALPPNPARRVSFDRSPTASQTTIEGRRGGVRGRGGWRWGWW